MESLQSSYPRAPTYFNLEKTRMKTRTSMRAVIKMDVTKSDWARVSPRTFRPTPEGGIIAGVFGSIAGLPGLTRELFESEAIIMKAKSM